MCCWDVKQASKQATQFFFVDPERGGYFKCLTYSLSCFSLRRELIFLFTILFSLFAFFHVALHVCLLVGCLTSQQQASVSQRRICEDNFTCCHNEIEAADQTFHLTLSQYTDTGPTSPSADPITPGAWQGSHWSANFFLSYWYDSTPKKSRRKLDLNPGTSALEADALTTGPTRRLPFM